MLAAETRYREALVKIRNADPGRRDEAVALEDMEDVLVECGGSGLQQRRPAGQLQRLLKAQVDAASPAARGGRGHHRDRRFRRGRRRGPRQRQRRAAGRRGPPLLEQVKMNPAAGRDPPLADRHAHLADHQPRELPVHAAHDVAGVQAPRPPEALFGILARNPTAGACRSRAGAVGLQFMPATGRRFGPAPTAPASTPATTPAGAPPPTCRTLR